MKIPDGHEFEYKQIRPCMINVDRTYQRDLDQNRVARIVKAFNPDVFNEPKVSYRNGQYYVFDGQHSVAAWVAKFGDKPILAKAYKGMTWLEEMESFVLQNGISKDPTTNEKLRAQYNSKNPDVCNMVDCAERAGFLVDFGTGQRRNRISATSALFKSYMTLGAVTFSDMLFTIRDAWGNDDYDAVSALILNGMTRFFRAYEGQFKSSDLANALSKISPAAIIRNAKVSTTGGSARYAKEILKTYNHRRTTRRLEDIL